MIDGLAKIGGYFALFGILNMVLFIYNEYSFQKNLKTRYKQVIQDSIDGKTPQPLIFDEKKPLRPEMIDDKVVTQTFSFEMLM